MRFLAGAATGAVLTYAWAWTWVRRNWPKP